MYFSYFFTVWLKTSVVAQVTTLVNTSNKGPSSKKKGRSKKAHVLAVSVEQATQNFLEKGEQIAKDSQDLKEELIAAVDDVRKQGELVSPCLCDLFRYCFIVLVAALFVGRMAPDATLGNLSLLSVRLCLLFVFKRNRLWLTSSIYSTPHNCVLFLNFVRALFIISKGLPTSLWSADYMSKRLHLSYYMFSL